MFLALAFSFSVRCGSNESEKVYTRKKYLNSEELAQNSYREERNSNMRVNEEIFKYT